MRSTKDVDDLRAIEELSPVLKEQVMSLEEALAHIQGESLDEARARVAFRARLRAQAEKYRNSTPSSWPFRQVSWDVRWSAQHFCLDGAKRAEFDSNYPRGFILGWVDTEDLDLCLTEFSHRTDDELWSVGSSSKLAYLIAFLGDGGSVSPPLVKPVGDGTIVFLGGHHRYALARALRQTPIPICAERENQEALTEALARVTWAEVPD